MKPKWRKSKIKREKHEPTHNMPKISTKSSVLAEFLAESKRPMCARSNVRSTDPA